MNSTHGSAQIARTGWGRTSDLDWMESAACRANPSAEHAFIYGAAKVRNQAINTFCGSCPVRKECLIFGEESMSEGVWGGVHRTMQDAQKLSNRQSSLRPHERGSTRAKVAKMYKAGLSMRKIARELCRSERLIRELIEESGTQVRRTSSGR